MVPLRWQQEVVKLVWALAHTNIKENIIFSLVMKIAKDKPLTLKGPGQACKISSTISKQEIKAVLHR